MATHGWTNTPAHANTSFKEPVPGYPKLADRMSRVPTLAMFDLFRDLAYEQCLHEQSELCRLRGELRDIQARDAADRIGMKYTTDYQWLKTSTVDKGPDGRRQLEIFKEIDGLLWRYYGHLEMCRKFANLPLDQTRRGELFRFLAREARDGVRLTGPDRDVYGSLHDADKYGLHLASINVPEEGDLLSNWVCETASPWILRQFRSKPDPNIGAIIQNDGRIKGVIRLIVCLLAGSVQISFVAALEYVQPSGHSRLALLAAFSVFISVLLVVTTRSTTGELFALNAAILAVQTALIGNGGPDWP